MPRVLFLDEAPIYGGHQATAITAAAHLAGAGFEVISAFDATNARLHAAWRRVERDVQLVPLPLRLTAWQPFLSPFGIASLHVRTLLETVQPQVVVAVQGTIVQSNRAVEQARGCGIPAVSFIPMGVHFGPGESLKAGIARLLARYHYTRPDAFITTSENARREITAGGGRAPIDVVYCGVDTARLTRMPRDEARRELGITGFTAALIGRVSFGTKGHDVMLRALAQLEDTSLLIVGDGPDEPRLEHMLVVLGLCDRVRRLPWLDDMSSVYSAADMIVIPSRFEGLPQVALEGMFYELPIVAADMGAMREILPDSWMFPAGDAEALAAIIRRLRHTDIRSTLLANRERVLSELNDAQYGRRFIEVLQRIIATTAGVRR